MQRQSVNDLTMSANNGSGPDHVSFSQVFVWLTLTSIVVVPLLAYYSPRCRLIFVIFFLHFLAYVPFTGVWIATEKINFEED